MKKFIMLVACLLALGVNNSSSQQVTRSGKTFEVSTTKQGTKSEPKATGYTYKQGDKVYPIYMGSTGSCFVVKISKKTGKEYRQYLGKEISAQICKEMGIEYKLNK